MSLPDATLTVAADPDRNQFVCDQLVAYNREHTTELPLADPPDAEPLEIYLTDSDGAVIGGLVGRTNTLKAWLEITLLWVEERHRGRGLGWRLIERAESEALSRRCMYARLATSTYQAPGFYERMGYRLYGTLENCPPGVTCLYYWKELRSIAEEDQSE